MKTLETKLEKLKSILSVYGQMIVALSGGVDSVFLLTFAYKLWGDDRVAAMTATGPHFADDESDYAKGLCDKLGISHKTIKADHVLPLIEDNPTDRCYICKKELFSILQERAQMVGSVLADGTNLDDMDDYRPGYRAILELGIASPLKEAGLTKAEIRQALKDLADSDSAIREALRFPGTGIANDAEGFMAADDADGPDAADSFKSTGGSPADAMTIWEKPAFACLASRIPYGEKITVEKLNAIYKAELFLREKGFAQVRIRHHGDVARIEVLPEDRSRFFDAAFMDEINEGIQNCGFKFAALDLGGYKMGSLNETVGPEGSE
ncbi:MAG: 7-cyano-7-deazaguanine synthase [Bacillota bacterium]|nr:7-cyano-7-deazaguanine synthase [Bacillota bacterium]